MRQLVFLQIAQRGQKRARRCNDARHIRKAERLRRLPELRRHGSRAQRRVKLRVRSQIYAGVEAVAQEICQRAVLRRRAAQKGLGRQKASKLVLHVLHRVRTGDLRRAERAGRHIAEAKAIDPGCAVDAGKIIVFGLHQHRAFRHRAGRYDADNVALYKPLC